MADLSHHAAPHAHALAIERSTFGSHNDIFLDTMEEPPPGTSLPEPARIVDRRICTADAATVAVPVRIKDDTAVKPFPASPVAPVAREDEEEPTDASAWRARVAELERHIKTLDADRADLTAHYQCALDRKDATLTILRLQAARLEFAQAEAVHFLSRPLAQLESSPPAAPTPSDILVCVRFAVQYLQAAHRAVANQQPVHPLGAAAPGAAEAAMGVTSPTGSDHVPLATLVPRANTAPSPATTTSTSVSLSSSPDRTATASPDQISTGVPDRTRSPTSASPTKSPLAGMRHAAHGRSLSLSAAVGLRGSLPLLASDTPSSETDLGATTQSPSTTDLPLRAGCTACRALALRLDQAADRAAQLTAQVARTHADLEHERALRARADQARDILDADLEDLTASLFAQANAMVEAEARRRDEVERALRARDRVLKVKVDECEVLRKAVARLETARAVASAARGRGASVEEPHPMPLSARVGSMPSLMPSAGGNSGLGTVAMGPPAGGGLSGVDEEEDADVVWVDGVELQMFQEFLRRAVSVSVAFSGATDWPVAPGSAAAAAAAGGSSAGVKRSQSHQTTALADLAAAAVHAVTASPTPGSTMAKLVAALDAEPLMKRILAEDIEPCLFAHPTTGSNAAAGTKLAAVVGSGPSAFRKKLLAAIATGQWECRASAAWPTGGVPAGKDRKCAVCGVARDCAFGLRLARPGTAAPERAASPSSGGGMLGRFTTGPSASSGTSTPSTPPSSSSDDFMIYPVDRFCRHRVSRVAEFYAWATGLRHEKVGQRPIVDLFRTFLWHKRRMAEARVGSEALFRESLADGVAFANVQVSH
ncbi:hypothetical protein GGF32_005790 [Allomyces javanicus]|nr:hypothetical protein GGF32_005790 [Allomyces javanicus]